jgi:hypothetical protein
MESPGAKRAGDAEPPAFGRYLGLGFRHRSLGRVFGCGPSLIVVEAINGGELLLEIGA